MKTVQNQAKPVSKQTWRNKVTYVKKNWQLSAVYNEIPA